MTDTRPDTDSESKPRGLWSLMGGGGASPSEPASNAGDAESAPQQVEAPLDHSDQSHESSKKRGLWGMMQPAGAVASTTDSTAAETPAAVSEVAQSTNDESRNSTKQGLFALMQRATEEVTPEEIDDLLEGLNENAPAKGHDRRPASLSIARAMAAKLPDLDEGLDDPLELPDSPSDVAELSPDEVTAEEIDDLLEELDQDDQATDDPPETSHGSFARAVAMELPDDDEIEDDSLELPVPAVRRSIPPLSVIDLDKLEPARYRQAEVTARRQCWIGIACGIASAAASALALLPQFWTSFPATVLGFAAIIAGYLALTGTSRRQIPSLARAASMMGILLGTAGIFLGPLLFANLGRGLRDETGQLATSRHLTRIAGGMDRFYGKKEEFPIGGTFDRDEAGNIKGQHGWMTFLLPFIGESDLYDRIDLTKPYDDPANRGSMERDVIPYFAAGGNRSRLGSGFAVAHFAGLGGEIDNSNRLSHIGVFEKDVAVNKGEITDGLSSTMIVGELAGSYPPWGDPENWRKVGRGLNKDPNGFGSAGGHGASFLFADGSVKHFSNKTDPKLLERLSTRDGGE